MSENEYRNKISFMIDRQTFPFDHIAPQINLNRYGERRRDEAWIDQQRDNPAAAFYLLVNQKIAIRSDEDRRNTRLRCFTATELDILAIDRKESCFLGIDDAGIPAFSLAVSAADAMHIPGGSGQMEPLVDLRTLAIQSDMPPSELSLAAQARSLTAWRASHRCCGRCGAHTHLRDGGWRLECWACGQNHFPRSDPAVIMLITHEDRCLLANEPRFIENMYSVLAGFVEPGDDIETAVRREISEEVGIRVGRVAYIGSQPWPFPHSLMIGCWGEALGTELTLDPVEITQARWFNRDEVCQMLRREHPDGLWVPPPISISHTLIRAYAEGRLTEQA